LLGRGPGYHTKDPFFRFWFRYVADNRSRLERHRTTGSFPPSPHFTASGSTGLPSLTADRIFYPNFYRCLPPLNGELMALHPLQEQAFTHVSVRVADHPSKLVMRVRFPSSAPCSSW
jgi:hypothetical protein